MNRLVLVVCGVLGLGVLLAHGACQGPDSFYRSLDAGRTSSGGRFGSLGGSGLGGSGLGGSGLGGSGLGGITGAGGLRGAGGSAGAIGAGGMIGAGGRIGAGGMIGAGGRIGAGGITGMGGAAAGPGDGGVGTDASTGCIAVIQAGGYTVGNASCSDCTEQTSFPMKCRDTIDCMRTPACTGNCYQECYNHAGGSGSLMSCVSLLLTAAGCPP